jgi:hypothetical protein
MRRRIVAAKRSAEARPHSAAGNQRRNHHDDCVGDRKRRSLRIDSVFTAKAMASCGNPPFSTLAVLQAEANFLALGGCLQEYDLDIRTNYKDIIDTAKEPPRGELKYWFTPFVLIVMGLVYNTKEADKP